MASHYSHQDSARVELAARDVMGITVVDGATNKCMYTTRTSVCVLKWDGESSRVLGGLLLGGGAKARSQLLYWIVR